MPALGQIDIVLKTIDGHVQPFLSCNGIPQRAATKLMSLCTNTVQQKKRLGQATVNLFNRAYNMVSQLQIESGQQLCLTTDEMASVQIWDVESMSTGGSILQSIANVTSWQQGFIWHYNVPVPIQQVSGPQHGWYQAHDGGFAGKYL